MSEKTHNEEGGDDGKREANNRKREGKGGKSYLANGPMTIL